MRAVRDVRTRPAARVQAPAVRARPPELVLADVMMPGLDGFGLLRELRADPATRELPVMLLSARAGEEARVEGLGAGADDYLVKPFAARELLARVGARIELARVRREAAEAVRSAQTALLRRLFDDAAARPGGEATRAGRASFVSGDRRGEGVFPLWSVSENIAIGRLARRSPAARPPSPTAPT